MYHSCGEQMHFPQWQEPEITKIITCSQKALPYSGQKIVSQDPHVHVYTLVLMHKIAAMKPLYKRK